MEALSEKMHGYEQLVIEVLKEMMSDWDTALDGAMNRETRIIADLAFESIDIVQLVVATRSPGAYDAKLAGWIEYGASPRATIALDRCARAHAWLAGRDFVSPDDVQAVAADVLRHRLLLSFEAEANGVRPDDVTSALLAAVPVG